MKAPLIRLEFPYLIDFVIVSIVCSLLLIAFLSANVEKRHCYNCGEPARFNSRVCRNVLCREQRRLQPNSSPFIGHLRPSELNEFSDEQKVKRMRSIVGLFVCEELQEKPSVSRIDPIPLNPQSARKKCANQTCDQEISLKRKNVFCRSKACLESRKLNRQVSDFIQDKIRNSLNKNDILTQKIKIKVTKISYSALCGICGIQLFTNEVKYALLMDDEIPILSHFAHLLRDGDFSIPILQKNGKFSVCRHCQENPLKWKFMDFGEIPDDLKNLNFVEREALSLGVLKCSTFRPKNSMSYLHLRGGVGLGPKKEEFFGTMGILYPGQFPSPPGDTKRISLALSFLRENNFLFKTLLPRIETIYGYFPPVRVGDPGNLLPQMPSNKFPNPLQRDFMASSGERY